MDTKLEQVQRWGLGLIKDDYGGLVYYHEACAAIEAAYQRGLADAKCGTTTEKAVCPDCGHAFLAADDDGMGSYPPRLPRKF